MRRATVRSAEWRRAIWLSLVLQVLCLAEAASGQVPPPAYGTTEPAFIALVARVDPLDPTRYVDVAPDEQSRVVAFFRGGQRLPFSVPQVLERDDEFETARDVMAVIRYPIGDVYVDAGTRVRIGSLDVLFGRVFAKVKGFFSVENQNVVAGVEGTEFAFEVARDGSTEITVLDGAVLSSSKRLPWKPLRVTRNQAFWVTDSGMQIKVGAAPPTELAQLQRWVDRADRAVAALAPREPQAPPAPPPPAPPPPVPQPEPQPQQSVPPSMQPVPQPLPPGALPGQSTLPGLLLPPPAFTEPSGYCCDASGQVYPSTAGACRGRLYQYRADAYAQCRDRRGFCCANNRVFETIPSQCTGIFSYNQASVRESCAAPAGYCCIDRRLTPMNRDQCKGTFYTDARVGGQACAGEREPAGYCCADGQVRPSDRTHCNGSYFVNEAGARKACSAPQPQRGWCCAGGRVSQTTQDRCGGAFSLSQSEALRACKAVIMSPKTDAGPTNQKPSSEPAKTKADTSPATKQPASDAAKTKVESSKVIRKPPPAEGPVVN